MHSKSFVDSSEELQRSNIEKNNKDVSDLDQMNDFWRNQEVLRFLTEVSGSCMVELLTAKGGTCFMERSEGEELGETWTGELR